MSAPTRLELLELDIDVRCADLWALLAAERLPLTLEQVAAYMRAAYGAGYVAALLETPAERGLLARAHGYRLPGGAA